jgi:hypothetical protein
MTIIGLDTAKLEALIRDTPGMVDEILASAANEILGDIVSSFNTSPPGRAYKRRTVVHVASVANYPPNVDTDALRASMKVRRVRRGVYHVEDGVEYGIYLEDGTERIEARPFVRPVFDEWRRRRFAALVARKYREAGLG